MTVLHGSTVAIVGAGSGIGRAVAIAATAAGAGVVLLGRSPAKLEETAAAAGGAARLVAVDMLDRAAVRSAIGQAGAIEHLVLTAVADEIACVAPVAELGEEQVERSFDKLRGYVNVVSAAARVMAPRGSITLLSGASALKPPAGFSVLAAAAGSIVSFGKALALELAPLRVNVLMPGVVDTPIHAGRRDQVRAWAESTLPVRRFGQPQELAEAVLFLMSNPYVTGHTLVVDGGLTAG